MRIAGKLKCGFYPLPLSEAETVKSWLEFPLSEFSALDPCIGDGVAFARITAGTKSRRLGIELGRLSGRPSSKSGRQRDSRKLL